MTPAQWHRVGELFHAAVAMPVEQRQQWLRQASPDDPEIAAEALSLLGSDAEAGDGFVARQVQPAVAAMLTANPGLVRVGPYKLLRELGRGGMGTVYLAERDDQAYQSKVAIKVVSRGMDTDIILHRFYRERQTLARLQHPHIARLLDGGTTPEGSPYIVMEYVQGAWITEYCRAGNLSVARRLRLLLDVCDAVAYAHRQFVVHRDIKPGNILVDETGSVKLLDFGICKLLQGEAVVGNETLDAGPAPLTPDYASPEQVRGEPANIASDVYSLAAVLYQLLTGRKPHEIKEFTPLGIERGICETEIVRPSLATEDKAVSRQLAGDLDNILLQALHKEPQRRYQLIEHFADDIRRHLDHQPVKARPDTLVYRAEKFLRRRAGLVTAIAIVLVTLTGGIWTSLLSAKRANENLALVRQLSNTFVFDVYDAVQDLPGSTRARKLIVQTGLKYLNNLSRNAANDMALQRELASAYRRIGDVQGHVLGANLGDTNGAMKSYHKAMEMLNQVARTDPSDRLAISELVTVFHRIADVQVYERKWQEALANYREAEKLASRLLARFPDDKRMGRELAGIHIHTSYAFGLTGDFQTAKQGYTKALQLIQSLEKLEPDDRELRTLLAAAFSGLGQCDQRMGRLPESLEEFRQATARLEQNARLDPSSVLHQRELMFAYSHIGDVLGNPNLRNLGDRAGAVRAYSLMVDVARRVSAADPADQRARSDLSIALTRVAVVMPVSDVRGRIDLITQALRLQEEIARVNPENKSNQVDIVMSSNFLGDAYLDGGDRERAERAFQKGIQTLNGLNMANVSVLDLVTVYLYRKLGVLAAGRGDRNMALEMGQRAIRLTDPEGPSAKNRPPAVQRFQTPRGYGAIGAVYAALAQSKVAEPEDAVHARRWLEKSMAHWKALEKLPLFADTHRAEMIVFETALGTLK